MAAKNGSADILFLGTGIMGAPMARRLAAAGWPVIAWNRSSDKAAALATAGIRPVPDLRGLASARRIAILMVSTGDVADDVLFGHGAARPAIELLAPGSTVIVMSSIPVETARAQAGRLAANGISYLDAPVSGGEAGAIEGSLSIMAGGDAGTIREMAPVLAPLGTVTHVGAAGAGSLAKLANQAIVGITIGAVAEAFVLAELGGVDLDALRRALDGGFAGSTVLRAHGARMASGDFRPGAHATTQLKDLSTALAFGGAAGGRFPILSLCQALYAGLCERGRGALDHSALYLDARDRAGLSPGAELDGR